MPFNSLLIANRGEIAIRIAQACADLGIRSVAVYAEDDGACLHTRKADLAVPLKGRGVPAYLVDNAAGIDPGWVEGKRRIGVTAGASAPEVLVAEVIARLKELSGSSVRNLDGVPERVTFPLPKELQDVR